MFYPPDVRNSIYPHCRRCDMILLKKKAAYPLQLTHSTFSSSWEQDWQLSIYIWNYLSHHPIGEMHLFRYPLG